jgi:hypothetical protein
MNLRIFNLLLLIISIYISLVFCDWILKKIKYKNLDEASKIKLNVYRDSILKKEKAFKEGLKFTIYPELIDEVFDPINTNIEIPPLSSFINSKSFLCDEGYGLIKYETDKFGFRNKNNVYEKKLDIMLLGDSFAHGACVEDKYTVAGILGKSLNVLNLGVGSTNPTHYLLNFEVFIKYFKPRNVVVIFYSNDYAFNENSVYESVLKNSAEYFDKNSFVDNLPTKYKKKVNDTLNEIEKNFVLKIQAKLNSKVQEKPKKLLRDKLDTFLYHLRLLEIRKHILIISKKYSPQFLPKNTANMLSKLMAKCNITNNCKPLVVLIPSSNYWDYDYRGIIFLNNLRENLIKNEIEYIDFSNKSKDKDFYAPKGIHLSNEGYSTVGKEILSRIMQLK